MRKPKGFGKNYFTLSAICAYSASSTLTSQTTAFVHSTRYSGIEMTQEEDDPLDELECLQESSLSTQTSSCHCNCFFKRLVYILAQIFKHHPQTYFIFHKRHTGIAPPHIPLNLI
jgi:hypothetical protein